VLLLTPYFEFKEYDGRDRDSSVFGDRDEVLTCDLGLGAAHESDADVGVEQVAQSKRSAAAYQAVFYLQA